ncbi:MAG: hypothetical protein QOI59_2263 [Gammaproteobacteria bacterium]|nr:hypothetical protein [Gammaproteobacteria bacterium]
MLRLILLVLSFSLIPAAAMADVAGAVNEARLHGCHANPFTTQRLRENSRLNEAARRLSFGETLQNAAKKAGYRSVTSAAVQISNVPDDRDVERIVAGRFCSQITARDLKDIGTYRQGTDVWVMVASPFTPPSPGDRQAISRRVLELTNQARAHARRCGAESFPAAPPLVLAPSTFERAAVEHSQDMANHNYMDHTGRDGSTPADRVTRTGYKWKAIGENLASGILTPEDAVNGWVGSPHHCENLMSARFTQMSVAYAVNAESNGGIYWTQLFGTPR